MNILWKISLSCIISLTILGCSFSGREIITEDKSSSLSCKTLIYSNDKKGQLRLSIDYVDINEEYLTIHTKFNNISSKSLNLYNEKDPSFRENQTILYLNKKNILEVDLMVPDAHPQLSYYPHFFYTLAPKANAVFISKWDINSFFTSAIKKKLKESSIFRIAWIYENTGKQSVVYSHNLEIVSKEKNIPAVWVGEVNTGVQCQRE